MFFVLSKTLGFFVLPSNIILMLGVLGVVLMPTRFARAGRRLAAASIVLIVVVGLSPLGSLAFYALESRFPAWDPAAGAPDGIIILGGSFPGETLTAVGEISLNDGAERLTIVPTLAARYPKARIVFSGGIGSLIEEGPTEAELALTLLESFGVPRSRIAVEDRSRNTYENAVLTKDLVQPKPGERWLLVTSAAHMPRAIGAFRAAGFPVTAHPVDWHIGRSTDPSSVSFSTSGGLSKTDFAAREFVGLAVYRLTGRSSAFFPGPE